MSLLLELPKDLESELEEEASRVGMSISDYALRMLTALQRSRTKSNGPTTDKAEHIEDEPKFIVLSADEFERINRQQKRLALREEYLRLLINDGHTIDELKQLLPELDMTDDAWLKDPTAEQTKLFQSTANGFQAYCAEQGIDYHSLNDESFSGVVDGLIKTVRDNNDAITHRS